MLTSAEVSKKFADEAFGNVPLPKPEQVDENATDAARVRKLHTARPFERLSLESLFAARSGSSDYLPDVADGDVTLLNAKADRFAVFVRRVALRVFGNLKRKSWQDFPPSQVRSLRGFTSVIATLDPSGKLLSAEVAESSGVPAFDSIVLTSARAGTWDDNPPAGARLPDGTIQFIFQARTWSRVAADGHSEQRWLLLGTGLR